MLTIKLINLSHVATQATQDTINLFNASPKTIQTDTKGQFVWMAYSCYKSSVICRKQYI